jgi:DNA-directed RNA polymerase alpha subunit
MSILNIETDVFDTTTFTIENIDVSMANAIRRTITNDIKTWVFMTSPDEKNMAKFITNTSRLNNEILKQRLSCIPIHVKYGFQDTINLEEYYLEVNIENTTDRIIQVTTEHFIVKKKGDNQPVSIELNREIFPPYISPNAEDTEEYFTLLTYLRPKISEEILGEKLHLTCDFSVSSAKENAMFNVASTCSYGNTVDEDKAETLLEAKIREWREEGVEQENIDIEVANWRLLDRKRIFKPDTFDFTLQSLGVFTNMNLMLLALRNIEQRIKTFISTISSDELSISESLSTMSNSFDIVFEDDYTIGKVLEFMLNKKIKEKVLMYCGYSKNHPHDIESVIRIAFHPSFSKEITRSLINEMLQDALYEAEAIFVDLSKNFLK